MHCPVTLLLSPSLSLSLLLSPSLSFSRRYETLISRVQSFGAYYFDTFDTHPVVGALFQDAAFQNAAHQVCPPSKPHLDPFQFNFIIQVPGQTVATHVDGVYVKQFMT